ncbi:hypothetical protein C4D60_Mb05t29130 [Musa balbisiana]|uniref:PEP-utilising enzyme C-terminal domain-containing protein n=1 Tax=Musa balbisiana TaxID=52838 RepID=A0A4S8JZR7_MUSBA|nr:hypothetical protein C4D60_Mb05t29130 [Musa balbisiana]
MIHEGDWLSLNGSTGEVILGRQPLAPPALSGDLGTFMSWVDEIRQLKVMANADTPDDALAAINNGAQGIGLCRTEHMFFSSDERIKAVREMIMAANSEQRQRALDLLLPYQKSDFEGIFHAMDGLPVTIRLLDPPLHEFLPEGNLEDIVGELASEIGIKEEEILTRVEKLSEVNPMLGFRGCRLGISYPELTEMQVRAIFEAAISVSKQGIKVFPEIMVPLIGTPQEYEHQMSLIQKIAQKVFSELGTSISYKSGAMIEVPRAALIADEVLDQKGVGQLIKVAVERGRRTRPDLKIGICGEHGGEPSSVAFFAQAGLDYVSCSPFRVPIARLAAAQVWWVDRGGRRPTAAAPRRVRPTSICPRRWGLHVAIKITSVALATRVSALESDVSTIRLSAPSPTGSRAPRT